MGAIYEGVSANPVPRADALEPEQILAVEFGRGRHPFRRPLGALLSVRRCIHGEEIGGIIGELLPRLRRPAIGAARPGIGQWSEVIDVEVACPGEDAIVIGVDSSSGHHRAALSGECKVREGRQRHQAAILPSQPVRAT